MVEVMRAIANTMEAKDARIAELEKRVWEVENQRADECNRADHQALRAAALTKERDELRAALIGHQEWASRELGACRSNLSGLNGRHLIDFHRGAESMAQKMANRLAPALGGLARPKEAGTASFPALPVSSEDEAVVDELIASRRRLKEGE